MLWANSADDKLVFSFFFAENSIGYFMQIVSLENRIWYFIQIVSLGGDNLYEMSNPILCEK